MPSKKYALKVYLAPEELESILANADKTGLSLSTFAKRVCLGSPVPSLENQQAVRDMLKINADLGRLGGLFKLYLATPDPPVPELPPESRRILREIEARQRELRAAIIQFRKGAL